MLAGIAETSERDPGAVAHLERQVSRADDVARLGDRVRCATDQLGQAGAGPAVLDRQDYPLILLISLAHACYCSRFRLDLQVSHHAGLTSESDHN